MRKLFLTVLLPVLLQVGVFAQADEFQKGINSAKSGEFQTALVSFQKVETTNLSERKSAQIHYNIGVCLYRLNQADKAVASFEKSVEIFPKYEKAYYGLAMAQVDLKDFSGAESNFLKAINLNKTNGETWFDLALVLCEQEKFTEAVNAFQNAVKFNSIAESTAKYNLEMLSKNEIKSTAKLILKEKK
jgi:tetratricopeptide (TPR) repeat protein